MASGEQSQVSFKVIETLIVLGHTQRLWFTFSEDTDGTEKSEEEDGLHYS